MRQRGQILVLALVAVGLVMVNTLVIISGSLLFFQNTKYTVQGAQALALAEAGIDKALAALNASGGNYAGEEETFLGEGSFSVQVINVDSNTKKIEATGYVPSRENVKTRRSINIMAAKGMGAAFNYGVQVGDGGLEMSNNSKIEGSVYSNGNIIMAGQASITGDVFVAGGIQPFPDQNHDCDDLSCIDYKFGLTEGGESRTGVSQSFQPATSGLLNKVALKLKKYGYPVDVPVYLLEDKAGYPDGARVLASGTLTANLVTSDYGFVEVFFPSPPSLTAGMTYWFMMYTENNNQNYWSWAADSLGGYTTGKGMWSNWGVKNPVWTDTGSDFSFRTYTGGVITYISGNDSVVGGSSYANTLQSLLVGGEAFYKTEDDLMVQGSPCVNNSNCHPDSDNPVAQPMPLSEANIQNWKNMAETAGVYSGDINNCPNNLPSGKYLGSLSVPNNCVITIDSPVWFTGTLDMNNGGILKLNPSYGLSSGVVVADNIITLNNNNKILGTGIAGSYLFLVSDFNSRDDPLRQDAVILNNNGNSGAVYTNLGSVRISQNNTLIEITAWKLKLENGVTVSYEQGLSRVFFTSGPSGSYALVKGTYQLK
ncbi:MAG: hypothetical protein C4584_02335 [Armatimonadetes bacterium]|nr:MAG: hypothetical protein C4584_02335 [Armatimonadota bacterium]